MKLIILPSSDEVATWTAKYVAKKINDFKASPSNYFVLGLPTGKCVVPILSTVTIVHYNENSQIIIVDVSLKVVRLLVCTKS